MHTTTMKRIAGELGVSITTVSKVLNNHADISEATRTRVLAKVEELGYLRNAVARSLSLRRTHTLGIVIPDLMHSFFVEIIAGIEPVASVRGYGLLLCSSGEDPHKERGELEMLRGRQVDGVVVASAHGSGNTDILQQFVKHGTTIVMIDRDDHVSVKCHRVLTNDEQVGQLATSHLIDTGRRAIAHIGGPPIVHAKRRERGWREALKARGVKVSEEWVVRGGFMESDGNRAMKRLLTVRPRIDAVFAANDPAAIGAMKAIWEAGLRVPDDIAVVGFDGSPAAGNTEPPLTTVHQPAEAMGRHMARLLVALIGGEPVDERAVILVPDLVVRDST